MKFLAKSLPNCLLLFYFRTNYVHVNVNESISKTAICVKELKKQRARVIEWLDTRQEKKIEMTRRYEARGALVGGYN